MGVKIPAAKKVGEGGGEGNWYIGGWKCALPCKSKCLKRQNGRKRKRERRKIYDPEIKRKSASGKLETLVVVNMHW